MLVEQTATTETAFSKNFYSINIHAESHSRCHTRSLTNCVSNRYKCIEPMARPQPQCECVSLQVCTFVIKSYPDIRFDLIILTHLPVAVADGFCQRTPSLGILNLYWGIMGQQQEGTF